MRRKHPRKALWIIVIGLSMLAAGMSPANAQAGFNPGQVCNFSSVAIWVTAEQDGKWITLSIPSYRCTVWPSIDVEGVWGKTCDANTGNCTYAGWKVKGYTRTDVRDGVISPTPPGRILFVKGWGEWLGSNIPKGWPVPKLDEIDYDLKTKAPPSNTAPDRTPQRPDLAIDRLIKKSESAICAGGSPAFRANIKNKGDAASGEFRMRWFADRKKSDGTQNDLKPGKAISRDYVWPNITKGVHVLRLVVDYPKKIKEWNEHNNTKTMIFAVKSCNKPVTDGEIAIKRVWTRDGSGDDKSTFRCGDNLQFAGNLTNTFNKAVDAEIVVHAFDRKILDIHRAIPPGQFYFYTPSMVPGGATAGTDVFSISISYGQKSLYRTGSFTITCSGHGSIIPATPSHPTARALDSESIEITWQDNSNNESGFHVGNGNGVVNVSANTTSYTWRSELTSGTYMCFHVSAYNEAGSSEWTQYVCTTTP
ncbi:hypothetical protein J5X84_44745 [Streptosporangiaceae bacterium NEAU-GS5]|nr:hypothetical protein [Streptosporangiaceae bacterium NEAU-GS5]